MSVRVCICIAAFRRPAGLTALLDSLSRLTFTKDPTPDVCVLVGDNDSAGTAEKVFRAFLPSFPWELRYFMHPERGLSQIRNRLILEAERSGAEYAAFIDDDERASPAWLEELLKTSQRFAADVVQGPVLAEYSAAPPAWVIRGVFFDRPARRTGDKIPMAHAGNVLLRPSMVRALGGFDDYFSRTGGEDTDLFLRAAAAGRLMVYCREAICWEVIGPDRTSAAYLLRRAFRGGNTWALCRLYRAPSPVLGAGLLLKASALVAAGLLAPAAIIFGRHWFARMACLGARGLGLIYGICGLRFKAY